MGLNDEFIDFISKFSLSLKEGLKQLQEEQQGKFEANYFMRSGKCSGCCFSCLNSICKSFEKPAFCSNCMVVSCYYNRRFEDLNHACNQECLNCKNIGCIDNLKFNIKEITKYI
ncbi:MAG: hypothetical protein WC511_07590 [Candidatus Pacearchaeota archaeon]|jgi:hypothetical protein